jgi:hypothetical protein
MGNKNSKNRKRSRSKKGPRNKTSTNGPNSARKYYDIDQRNQPKKKYKVIETLSECGLFGKVYKVQMKNGGFCAMKKIEI